MEPTMFHETRSKPSAAFDDRMALLLVAGAALEVFARRARWQRCRLYKVCVTHLSGKQPTTYENPWFLQKHDK
jgi:hypothetical protein